MVFVFFGSLHAPCTWNHNIECPASSIDHTRSLLGLLAKVARSVLEFAGLPWHDAILGYIKTHCNSTDGEATGRTRTLRQSSTMAFKWLATAGDFDIERIESLCRVPMEKMGYRKGNIIWYWVFNEDFPSGITTILSIA